MTDDPKPLVPSGGLSRNSEPPEPISTRPGAERARQFRQRRRDGQVLCRIWVSAEAARELVDLGWMPPGADAKKTREAMLAILEGALDRGIRPRA